MEKEPRPGISPCDWVSGAAMVIDVRRSPLKYLNERYYFGCDDVEFCFALSRLGYSVAIVEDAVVWHKLGTARAVFNKKAAFKYVRNLQSNLKFNLNNNPYILKKGLVYISQIIIALMIFVFPGLNTKAKGFQKE